LLKERRESTGGSEHFDFAHDRHFCGLARTLLCISFNSSSSTQRVIRRQPLLCVDRGFTVNWALALLVDARLPDRTEANLIETASTTIIAPAP